MFYIADDSDRWAVDVGGKIIELTGKGELADAKKQVQDRKASAIKLSEGHFTGILDGHAVLDGRAVLDGPAVRAGQFWRDVLERALKTAAQIVATTLAGEQVINAFSVDWQDVAGLALGGFFFSFLTSILSFQFGEPGTASVISAVSYKNAGSP